MEPQAENEFTALLYVAGMFIGAVRVSWFELFPIATHFFKDFKLWLLPFKAKRSRCLYHEANVSMEACGQL